MRHGKKTAALLMASALTMGILAGCGDSNTAATEANTAVAADTAEATDAAAAKTTAEDTEETTTAAAEETEAQKADGFSIRYPSYLTETVGESLEMDEKPEHIICLSNSALQILVRCDIQPIAITSPGTGIDYPDWVDELPVIETGMSEVDSESIISMEPDLVIMGSHLQEDYGPILEGAGIPVYYTSEGPSITYNEVKEEATVLSEAFGGEEEKEEILAEFEALENRAAEYKESHESKQMMILFSAPPSYQQTSQGYLGSMLSMLPFENMSDTLIDPSSRTAPLDLEKLVEINPEILFAISPTMSTAEALQASYEEEFANNPQIWDNLQAVSNDNIIYLSNEYVTSKGIQIIKSMNALMDMLEEKLG